MNQTTRLDPNFPHLVTIIDNEKLTATETCHRCGKSEVFSGARVILNSLDGGSSFMNQHRLPNCGANGIRDLVKDSEE